MRKGAALTSILAVSLALLSACDGPSGPGSLVGRVVGESVGATVLEVEGTGIRGFSGRGATRVYAAAVAGRANVHRVILVDPVGGDMGFEIEVDDRGMEGPIVTVVQSARTDNSMMPSGSVTVRLER